MDCSHGHQFVFNIGRRADDRCPGWRVLARLCWGVNAGGGRRLPPRESGGIYHEKNLDILHKKSRYSA